MMRCIFALLCMSCLVSAQDPSAPPPVVFLIPGFQARELPVRLTNINNVRYGPDGRIYACGYDGRVHVLVDSDGDGVADTQEILTQDWVQERHNSNTRNDASGIALDERGNLYFCVGCSDYANPLL